MTEITWSVAQAGLQLGLERPTGPPQAGSGLPVPLHFRNGGGYPLRLYWVDSEPFRGLQSILMLWLTLPGAGVSVPATLPQLQPHGYVVTEADFLLVPAGQTAIRRQTLWIPASYDQHDFARQGITVGWIYENTITAWPGGVLTLDGPTRTLFGGGPIPYI
ncbi:MAG: hypothetical protein M3Z04_03410, partial [Chloroflexota bacterium]|nr:hypothetical protein [Chloroflexota bacterium]